MTQNHQKDNYKFGGFIIRDDKFMSIINIGYIGYEKIKKGHILIYFILWFKVSH